MNSANIRATVRSKLNEGVKHSFVLLMMVASFYPLYIMLNISLKDNSQFFNNPWWPQIPLQLKNFTTAWEIVGSSIPNTVFMVVTSTVGTLFIAIMAAYAFARFTFPFKKILWCCFMVLMLMPGIANLIPLFTMLRTMGLLNTYTAIIVLSIANGQVFNTYILKNYIEDTAESLFEAAEMDGAGHLRQIKEIVIPMNGPIIASLACLQFVKGWNNFLLPLLLLRDPDKLPISVSLFRLEGAYVRQWGPTMAAYVIAAIPLMILFVFTMRFFIKGIGEGAVKG